jgi:hypothetical protein
MEEKGGTEAARDRDVGEVGDEARESVGVGNERAWQLE